MREPALPEGVPQPLDQELLAWAAGFFDGEGTTYARTDGRRPEYFQLDVAVPQKGPNGVPEVLVKFQRAMLGIGKIYPQHHDDLYKWSAGGRVGCEASLALMWPWLGVVKRHQAQVALERVDRQVAKGAYQQRAPRVHPALVAHPALPMSDPRRLDFAWAAGFLDAEGYFGLPRQYERADGTSGRVIRASATQHGEPHRPPAVLEQLLRVLGGRIECHGEVDDFKWVTEGPVNVGHVLEEVRAWLGPVKTLQAETALEVVLASRVRGDADRCKRGHLYDRIAVRPDGSIHRICNTCTRINEKAKRAAAGSKPRNLKNPPTDPTRTYAT